MDSSDPPTRHRDERRSKWNSQRFVANSGFWASRPSSTAPGQEALQHPEAAQHQRSGQLLTSLAGGRRETAASDHSLCGTGTSCTSINGCVCTYADMTARQFLVSRESVSEAYDDFDDRSAARRSVPSFLAAARTSSWRDFASSRTGSTVMTISFFRPTM